MSPPEEHTNQADPVTEEAVNTSTEKMSEMKIKHPLQHTWVLWYDNPKKMKAGESWEENLKKIYTFDTVEEFWRLYENILVPSKLPGGSNYHLFKEGVRPMWEDPQNKEGGKWIFTNPKAKRSALDDHWMYTLLCILGDNINDNDDVRGVVISARKNQDRIAIWTGTAENESLQKTIGKAFRDALGLSSRQIVLKYQSHADASASGSSFQNEVHYEI